MTAARIPDLLLPLKLPRSREAHSPAVLRRCQGATSRATKRAHLPLRRPSPDRCHNGAEGKESDTTAQFHRDRDTQRQRERRSFSRATMGKLCEVAVAALLIMVFLNAESTWAFKSKSKPSSTNRGGSHSKPSTSKPANYPRQPQTPNRNPNPYPAGGSYPGAGNTNPGGYPRQNPAGNPGGYPNQNPGRGGTNQGGYPNQNPAGGYPNQNPGGYPNQGYPNQNPGRGGTNQGGYPNQNPAGGGYPAGGYPNQNPGRGYPNQNPAGGYPNQNPGRGYPNQNPAGGYPNQNPGGYPAGGYPNQYPGRGYPNQYPAGGGYPAAGGGYPGGYPNYNPNNKIHSPHYGGGGGYGHGGYGRGGYGMGGSPFSRSVQDMGYKPKSSGFAKKAIMAAGVGAVAGMAVGYGLGRFPRPHFNFRSPEEEHYYNNYMYRRYGSRSTDEKDYGRDYEYKIPPRAETYDSFIERCMNRSDLLKNQGSSDGAGDDTVGIEEIGYPALIEQMKMRRCVENYMVYSEQFLVERKAEQRANPMDPKNRSSLLSGGLVELLASLSMLLCSMLLLQ